MRALVSEQMLKWAVVGAVGCVVLVLCAVALGSDQVNASFSDPERVAQFLDNSPGTAVKLLEGVLSKEQVTVLERAMFPELGADEKRGAYEKIEADLKRIGLAEDDPLRQGVSARIKSLEGAARGEGEP